MKAAMKEAGYSDAYSSHPAKMTRKKSWKELMDEYLPEEDVAALHKELKGASYLQQYEFPEATKKDNGKTLTDEDIKAIVESVPGCVLTYIKNSGHGTRTAYFRAPDNRVRDAALDKAYKLRGRYAAEKMEVTDPYDNLSNADLARKIAKLRAFLQKKPIPK